MAMDEVGLGKSIQLARQAAGITQQELCQKANLSYSTLAKIERGAIKSPSIFTIQRIVTALGIDLNKLLGSTTPVVSTDSKKSSRTGIRFVYFDINGCLVRFFHKAFTSLAADTGLGAEAIETAFWHYNDAVCRGEISLEEFNKRLADKLNVPEINWTNYYIASVESVPEMFELVNWAAQYYYVGLMSNIMPGLIDILMEKGKIPKLNYTAIIDSSQIGAVKPELKIYEVAQQRSGVQPSEILLVDDSRANLMAADHLGWHVLWFDNYEPSESVPRIKNALEFEQNLAPPIPSTLPTPSTSTETTFER